MKRRDSEGCGGVTSDESRSKLLSGDIQSKVGVSESDTAGNANDEDTLYTSNRGQRLRQSTNRVGYYLTAGDTSVVGRNRRTLVDGRSIVIRTRRVDSGPIALRPPTPGAVDPHQGTKHEYP